MGPRHDTPWKTGHGMLRCSTRFGASMGPRQGRGRRGRPTVVRAERKQCFNGATHEAVEDLQIAAGSVRTCQRLQWGHDTSRGRPVGRRATAPMHASASMGPRHDGRGKPRSGRCSDLTQCRFNGATARGRGRQRYRPLTPAGKAAGNDSFNGATHGRGRRRAHRPRRCESSFNGATARGRGRRGVRPKSQAAMTWLQWGHGKGRGRLIRRSSMSSSWSASMGPRHAGRGRPATRDADHAGSTIASMGPRHAGRGRPHSDGNY